jgi:hypothetical protein
MWPSIRRVCTYFNNYWGAQPGDREHGYALAFLSLCALADPVASERTKWVGNVNDRINGSWTTGRCAEGGRDCYGRNKGQYVVDTYYSTPGPTTFSSSNNSRRAVVTNGSEYVTFLNSDLSPYDTTYKFFAVRDDPTAQAYAFERISSTRIRLKTIDGTAYRAYQGPSSSASGVEFQMEYRGNLGLRTQPFMQGIMGRGLDWAHKASCAAGNCNENAAKYLADIGRFIVDYGHDPVSGGVWYTRTNPPCELNSAYGSFATVPSRIEGCASQSVAAAREIATETFGALAAAYMVSGDAKIRTVADFMYAKAFGKPGWPCAPDLAEFCGDGTYTGAIENTYAGGFWFDTDKYLGFAFGFGGSLSWPAARIIDPKAKMSQNVPVGFTMVGVPGAEKVRITVTEPTGTTRNPIVCTDSPCVVSVDPRQGDHLMKIEYLSGSGKVLSRSDSTRIAM